MPVYRALTVYQPKDADLTALADLSGTGVLKRTGTATYSVDGNYRSAEEIVDADGELLLADTQWEDLRFPAIGINPPDAASDPTRDTTDGRVLFSASARTSSRFRCRCRTAGSRAQP